MPVKHKAPGREATQLERWLYNYRKENPHPEKKPPVPGFDAVNYRKKVQYYAFLTMVISCCRKNNKFNKDKIINEWWNFAFIKPFPKEGGSLSELTEKIRLKIWDDNHEEVESAEQEPYILKSSQDYQEAKDCLISKLQTEEAFMATKTKTKTKTKGKIGKSEEPKKKAARKDPKDRKLDKSGQSRLLCVDLLMEQKYTDDEIVEKIKEELDYPYSVKRVERIRLGINEGKREKQGIPAPNPPLEPIGRSGKSGKAKTTVKAKAKTGKVVKSGKSKVSKTKTKKTRSKR